MGKVPGKVLILSMIGALALFSSVFAENVLINGDFEQGLNEWSAWGGQLSVKAHKGKNCAIITNREHLWSGLDQTIRLPDNARSFVVKGWMKTDSVVMGKEEWENAQISVEFVDETDTTFGEYPRETGTADGTTDWTEYSSEYSTNHLAYAVKVTCALGNATGTAYFDNLSLEFFDGQGKPLSKKELKYMESEDTKRHAKNSTVLINGDFENGSDGWAGEVGVSSSAHSGKRSVFLENTELTWKSVEQKIAIPINTERIIVSGWIKADAVIQGREEWAKASLSLEFQNSAGKKIGDYPPTVAEIAGTTGWIYYQRSYRMRAGTKKISINCALDNAKGRVYFDDIKVTLFNKDGNPLKAATASGPTDEGEWYALPVDNKATGSHYVDWSSLLDPPAGRHGMLKAVNGHFRFADGTPAKFYGVVLCGPKMFTDKVTIDSLVSRLSKMGCNLLRLHHMDAEWAEPNIFGNGKGTRQLSPEMMERLDYLVYACKRKGIYLFFDMIVNRQFTKEDSVDTPPAELGAKQVGFFSKRLIALQKEYISQVLTHKNKYTKLAYKDDPAIVLSEIINETTIFTQFSEDQITGHYKDELEALWNASQSTGKKLAGFTLNWDYDSRGILKNQVPGASVKESIDFLQTIEENFFRDMHTFMRGIGVKYPIAGSNMPLPILAMIKSNAAADFMADDAYWDHPQLWKTGGNWDSVKYAPIDNGSQLQSPQLNGVSSLAYYTVHNKPYVVWGNHSYPNEYQVEENPFIAAYASLLGWDGILQHEFDYTALGADSLGSFLVSRQPEDIALWVMSAPLFLRNDIKQAPGLFLESITREMMLSDSSYSDLLYTNYFLPFVTRVAKVFGENTTSDMVPFQKYYDKENEIFRSETGELLLDGKQGILQINAPKVQGAAGFIGGKTFEFPLFELAVTNSHAAIFAISRDNKPLVKSRHFYLIASGPSKMTGQKFNVSRTALRELGRLPVLLQIINGSIVFKNSAAKSKMKIIPLTPAGQSGEPLPYTDSEEGTVFDFSKGRTLVYEVVIGK